jgi:hypothetical protein
MKHHPFSRERSSDHASRSLVFGILRLAINGASIAAAKRIATLSGDISGKSGQDPQGIYRYRR